MSKNKVENTAKLAQENPKAILGGAMIFGASNSIECMEERGTAQLAESGVLPSAGLVLKISEDKYQQCYAEWAEKCGIKVLELVEGDDVFVHVELPPGWRQERTDHAMWNELLDDKGRKRASIFYKAAFYDRSAYIRLDTRFKASYEPWDDTWKDKRCFPVVTDGGKEIWRGEVIAPTIPPYQPDDSEFVRRMDIADEKAKQWLIDNGYPDYEEVNAYWD